jgi:DNA-binding response OmpR family regulator
VKLLVIEDDPTVGQYVKRGLEEQRWGVDLVTDGEAGEARATSEAYDLIVLDMRLPGRGGLQVLKNLRARGFERPVLVLTAQDAVDAKVEALRSGADDYVTKPFAMEELLARARAAMRRAQPGEPTPPSMRYGGLEIDLGRRLVTLDGDPLRLTPTEYLLLEALATNPGKLLTHQWLLRKVWGQGYGTETTYLRTYVRALRKKLGDDAQAPQLIVTEPGVGYRWIAESSGTES